MKVLFFVFLFFFFFSPLLRCFVFNLHNVGIYSLYDIFMYFKNKKWRFFNSYGIDMFVGMFGHGKTLSMVHKARNIYKKYGDSIIFISNIELFDIPYIPLLNFNQLVDLGGCMPEGVQGYVVLIDEISSVLSHRNYANFPLELIGLLCQQRKRHVYIMCTAQRFFMVDKIFRSITTNVIDCNKYWRFCNNSYYDAWDYENAMNNQLIRKIGNLWWFVKNRDFECYDTSQMISKSSVSDFISNEESLVRKGLDSTVNYEAVKRKKKRRSS